MDRITDSATVSEEPEPQLVCPCGDQAHAPLRVGTTFSTSGPERDLYDCPVAVTHRYGIGPAS